MSLCLNCYLDLDTSPMIIVVLFLGFCDIPPTLKKKQLYAPLCSQAGSYLCHADIAEQVVYNGSVS